MKHPRMIAAVYPMHMLRSLGENPEALLTVYVVRPVDASPDWSVRGQVRIEDVSMDLAAMGVRKGMRVSTAQRFAPELRVEVLRREHVEAEIQVLAELCLAASPLVEPVDGFIFLDLTGIPTRIKKQLADIQMRMRDAGYFCSVGAAPGKNLSKAVAKAAAAYQAYPEPVYISKERQSDAVRRLPLEVSGCSEELCEILGELGIETLGELEALPKSKLSVRMSNEAKFVFDMLASYDNAPVVGIHPEPEIVEVREFEFPVLRTETLMAALTPMCARLCQRLGARGQKLRALEVMFTVEPVYGSGQKSALRIWELSFPEPIDDPAVCSEALRVRLEKEGVLGEVSTVSIQVGQAAMSIQTQKRLWRNEDARDVPDALCGLLAELMVEVGPEQVGCPVPVGHILPEKMTALTWPYRNEDAGQFRSQWPWPLSFLPTPRLLRERVVTDEPFAQLSVPAHLETGFVRDYRAVVLDGGRKALCTREAETENYILHAWFD